MVCGGADVEVDGDARYSISITVGIERAIGYSHSIAVFFNTLTRIMR